MEPHGRSNTVEEYRNRWMGARRCSLDGLLTRSTAVCSCGVSIQCAFSWSLMHCVSGRKAAAFQQDAQADYETIFGNVRSTQGRWTLSKHWSYPVNNGGVRVVTERERELACMIAGGITHELGNAFRLPRQLTSAQPSGHHGVHPTLFHTIVSIRVAASTHARDASMSPGIQSPMGIV